MALEKYAHGEKDSVCRISSTFTEYRGLTPGVSFGGLYLWEHYSAQMVFGEGLTNIP